VHAAVVRPSVGWANLPTILLPTPCPARISRASGPGSGWPPPGQQSAATRRPLW